MEKIIKLTFLLIAIIAQDILADPIKSIGEKNLVYFLNNSELVAEENVIPMYTIRIYKLVGSGECNKQKCAKTELYVAISEFGEYPKQSVFLLPKSYDWTFDKWTNLPRGISPNVFIEFEITRKNKSNRKVTIKKLKIKANPWKANAIEIE